MLKTLNYFLREAFWNDKSKIYEVVHGIVALLIIISFVSIIVSFIPGVSELTQKFAALVEAIMILSFTAEYLFRLLSAEGKERLSYALGFWGLSDLGAFLPFYLSAGLVLIFPIVGSMGMKIASYAIIFRLLRLGFIFRLPLEFTAFVGDKKAIESAKKAESR